MNRASPVPGASSALAFASPRALLRRERLGPRGRSTRCIERPPSYNGGVSPTGFESLKALLETAPAARDAARPLARGAEVAVIVGAEEPARFTMESGEPRLLREPPRDPDFTLTIPEKAVARLTGLSSADVGEYGVAFFTLVVSREPDVKVRVRINAPTTRLLTRGYLGVLAVGGLKVTWWLLGKGVKNPKAAIDRLRERR